MRLHSPRRRTFISRSTDDSGAAAVEFAILTPLIFMILFGMLSTGLAWNSKQTLTYAAREGARYGATLALDPQNMQTWLSNVASHTANAAQPELSTSTNEMTICVAYVGDSTQSLTRVGTVDTFGSSECPPQPDGRTEPRVQVYVSRVENLIAPGVPDEFLTPTLRSRAIARHELTVSES